MMDKANVSANIYDSQVHIITGAFILMGIVIIVCILVIFLMLRQKRQESELKLAEAANKAKTNFLFNMSHDIRTPMNAILGFTDIALSHSEDEEKVRDCLSKIKISGSHLLNLINDILEMTRIESGQLEINDAPADLRQIINESDLIARALASDKDIDYCTSIRCLTNPYVYADELHLNEVIINLISNAIKYTNNGGKVDYLVEQISEACAGVAYYRFTVSDNGIGISEDFQKHLFELFTRELSGTDSMAEGAGLGLSIVKRLVDLAGGTIRVISKLGEGSKFIVEIPLRIMDENAVREYIEGMAEVTKKPDVSSLRGKKVLLVEDNEMNREIAGDMLADAGMTVEQVPDGEAAVRTIDRYGVDFFDFVLMDIQMPVMNGFEATRRIREMADGNRVKIIAVSANAFAEDVQKSLDAGMNAHTSKPIRIDDLLETMQNLK